MAINFPSNPSTNQTYEYQGSTWIYTDGVWNVISNSTPVTISTDNFKTISVSGQDNVVADSPADTLTFVAGTNITITTDASTDEVTINSTAAGGETSNSFATIAVSGQSNVVADSGTDTLTLAAGSGISITTNAGTDTITIASTVSSGSSLFSGLSDASSASLTIDKIYLPAITMFTVTNNGVSAYRFDQYGSTDNPTIYVINGTTVAFNLQASGHPFLIQNSTGSLYNIGLIHVSTTGIVSTGSDAQGKDSGTLYWKIPSTISSPPSYRYQCGAHAPMVGQISIKNFGSI